MQVTSFGGTDPGKKRDNNEDAYLLDDGAGLYAVADGIGGIEGGEVASRVAVETLAEAAPVLTGDEGGPLHGGIDRNFDPAISSLRRTVHLANRKIRRAALQGPGLSGMGTTLTALLLKDGHALLAHVGDSRAYLLRDGELNQLTNDHSLVAEQLRAGVITPEQARRSPYRHTITRALGIEDEARPDLSRHAVRRDDRFLLCTDGLTEMVEDAEIGGIIAASAPAEAVQKLLSRANDRGGVDNITAVVVWVTEI